jgi:hypothetical protein
MNAQRVNNMRKFTVFVCCYDNIPLCTLEHKMRTTILHSSGQKSWTETFAENSNGFSLLEFLSFIPLKNNAISCSAYQNIQNVFCPKSITAKDVVPVLN